MATCPKCNREAPEGVSRCPHDGTPLPRAHQNTGTMLGGTGVLAPAPANTAGPAAQASAPAVGKTAGGATHASATATLNAYLDEEPTEVVAGTLVGEYEVTAKLGEGGMGEVYAAVHPIIGKRVAIKVLSEQVASNREVVRRFVAEASAVNQIGHAAIVDVFAFGQLEDGRHYFVMEHLEGLSLEDALDAQPVLSSDVIVDYALQTLDALQAAHNAGIVHRDLKPDNIFLVGPEDKRRVKLLDFGIAKLSGEDAARSRTRTGIAMGTPDYMSPEQCRGDSSVDHHTDIYAIGVILYRMFTGHFPFEGVDTAMELFVKVLHEEPPPPRDHVRISPAIEVVILRCLAKKTDDRYDSAQELAEVLKGAFAEGETSAGPGRTVGPGAGQAPSDTELDGLGAGAAPSATPQDTAISVDTAEGGRGKGMWIGAALAGVVVVSGAAFAMMGGTQPAPDSESVAVAADAAPLPPRFQDAAPVAVISDAAPAAKFGTLIISTNLKKSEVWLNGKRVGTGDYSVTVPELPPGGHVVKVMAKGRRAQNVTVAIVAGEETRQGVALKRAGRKHTQPKPDKPVRPDLKHKDDTLDWDETKGSVR